MSEDLSNVRRWTARRRSALVLNIVKGETSAKEAASEHGLWKASAWLLGSTGPDARE